MGQRTLWILGAADPEMVAIEALLLGHGQTVAHAQSKSTRVHPGNAYTTDSFTGDDLLSFDRVVTLPTD